MPDEPRPPTLTVSLERKINLGNYESASIFLAVSGVPVEATENEAMDLVIQALRVPGKIVYDALVLEMRARVAEAHEGADRLAHGPPR